MSATQRVNSRPLNPTTVYAEVGAVRAKEDLGVVAAIARVAETHHRKTSAVSSAYYAHRRAVLGSRKSRSRTPAPHDFYDAVADLAYFLQLRQLLHHLESWSPSYVRLSDEERKLVERYYLGHGHGNPTTDAAADVVLAYRRQIKAEDIELPERAEALVQRLMEAPDFGYYVLKHRILTHLVEAPKSFRDLPARSRYFLIEDALVSADAPVAFGSNQTSELDKADIRRHAAAIVRSLAEDTDLPYFVLRKRVRAHLDDIQQLPVTDQRLVKHYFWFSTIGTPPNPQGLLDHSEVMAHCHPDVGQRVRAILATARITG